MKFFLISESSHLGITKSCARLRKLCEWVLTGGELCEWVLTFSLSRTVFEIFDFEVFGVWPWPLTFRGHLRSKIFSPFGSPYMTSYLTSTDTFSLSRTVFEIFDFKIFRVWPWPLTFKSHLRSKIFSPFESKYMTSYLTFIDTFSLSRTVFEISDFKVFRVWPWPLTFEGHLRSKIFSPFESSYMTSYLTSIDTFSLSRTVFEIFDFKLFRVWPWPLTFRGHPRSKIFSPFESPFATSYLTSIDTFSLSRTVFEIFVFKVFRVWPWPLTFRGHLKSIFFSPFESSYMIFYLTSIDTFSLSRTVFEIFDFKLFRVWPWPLTFRGHPRSKIFSPFESPFATSYLTSIDTFSLSLTVFEIFVFKVFWVWPWPLTFRGHLRSNFFSPFEGPYMTSYLTNIDTISLSRTVFEKNRVKILKAAQNGGFWPFQGQGHWPIFFISTKGSDSHQMTSNDVLRVKIGPAVLAAPSSKSVKSYKKKKKDEPLYVGYMYLRPGKFFRNQILLDYVGQWRNQSCQIFFQSVDSGVFGKGSNFAIFSVAITTVVLPYNCDTLHHYNNYFGDVSHMRGVLFAMHVRIMYNNFIQR